MSTALRVSAGINDVSEATVLFKVINRVAILSLNRPAALNALTVGMIAQIGAMLRRCRDDDEIVAVVIRGNGPKAFCAGGDVRALYQQATVGRGDWLNFFIDEYRMDYAIHTFPKPVVALMDGITMGGGMGLAQGAWLRVVTERSRLAMPETRIGLLPDVGATWFLSRLPAESALYLGLTGVTLGGPDAVYVGLADVCVPSTWLQSFEERLARLTTSQLCEATPDVLRRSLRSLFEPPDNLTAHPQVRAMSGAIRALFDPRHQIEDVLRAVSDALRSQGDPVMRRWLQSVEEALTSHSPTMLLVAREAILRGRNSTLAECFRRELGIVKRCVEDGDFREGVRALLIEKDHQPKWAPSSVWELRHEKVRTYLASPWRLESHPLRDIETMHP